MTYTRLNPDKTLYEAAWTATSSNAYGTQLTQKVTVPPGTYIVSASLPTISTGTFMAGIDPMSDNFVNGPMYTCASFLARFTSSTQLYLKAGGSTSCTFSNLARGGLKALRIA